MASNLYNFRLSEGGVLTIFGKTPQPGSPVYPGEPAPAPAPTAPRPVAASSKTVIGSGSRVVGDVISDEDLLLEGQVEGKVRGERSVTIGSGGDLEGDVAARTIIVGGKVRGQIAASERAELMATAVVHGSVQAPKIVIAEGAHLQGNVAMTGGSEPSAVPRRTEES